MANRKQSMSFPSFGQIRKGAPKINVTKGQQTYQVVGPDLAQYFRIVFAPGAEDVRDTYLTLHPEARHDFGKQSTEPLGVVTRSIRGMLAFPDISQSWTWANEAYTTGRRVAVADDDHFLSMRDPMTGAYTVVDGEPFVPFQHGQAIKYQNAAGKEITLPIRNTCRLTVFMPELGRWGSFEFKSTSYYDRVALEGQLQTLQFFANTLNRGNVAGIPFTMYRREQEVCWNKPDGSAQRVKKWLVNVEADPDWVKAAMSRMSNFALTGETITRALLPMSGPITGAYSPDSYDDEGEGPESPPPFIDIEPEAPPEPVVLATPPAAPSAPAVQPADIAPPQPVVSAVRPYGPEKTQAELLRMADRFATYTTSDNQHRVTVSALRACLLDYPDHIADEKMNDITTFVFGSNMHQLRSGQVQALMNWLKPTIDRETSEVVPNELALQELQAILLDLPAAAR